MMPIRADTCFSERPFTEMVATGSSAPAGGSSAAEAASEAPADGLRPEFQEAMDSYETFMEEYCAFMEKYSESDGGAPSLLADYASFLSRYAEMTDAFAQWEEEEMNDAELAYYLEVQTRVSQKLLETAQ